jgi:ketosteroid isomerase-like protein
MDLQERTMADSHQHETKLRSLYAAFNERDVDTALAGMTPDVDWANGWEGGRVVGREAVRDYWRRQWAEIDSSAEPTAIEERADGRVEVTVRLVARDKDGKVLNDSTGRHIYDFRGDLVERMTIED